MEIKEWVMPTHIIAAAGVDFEVGENKNVGGEEYEIRR